MKKKEISLSLVLILASTFVSPASIVNAADGEVEVSSEKEYTVFEVASEFNLNNWTFTETDTTIKLNSYIGSSTSIYIPGEHNGKNIIMPSLEILPKTIEYLKIQEVNTKKVLLETDDLFGSFIDKTLLKQADLSGLNVSNVTSLHGLFKDKEQLNYVNLNGWDTSNVVDMSAMFVGTAVEKLNLSHFNTSNVRNMEEMFGFTEKLNELNISTWDTSNVTNMSAMFVSTGLEKINLSHFNTSKVKDVTDMFAYTRKLKELNVNTWDTSNVEDMTDMFSSTGLEKLDLSHFNTSKVHSMAMLFYRNYDLKELNVSTWDTSNVRYMPMMFSSTGLEKLDLSNFNTSKVENMDNIFAFSDKLQKINLSNWDLSNIQNMKDAFETDKETPLLVMANDEKILNYDFSSDKRVGLKGTLDADGGVFKNKKSTLIGEVPIAVKPIDYNTSSSHIESFFLNYEVPTKDKAEFMGWSLPWVDTLDIGGLHTILSGTMKAVWKVQTPETPGKDNSGKPIETPKTPETPKEENKGTLKNGTVKASVLNVRKGNKTSYSIIDKLKRGTNVTILETKGGWHKIKLSKDKTGWIDGTYVEVESKIGTVTASILNMRKGNKTSYGVISKLKKGTSLDILETKDGWHKVKLSNGKTGWVSKDYVKTSLKEGKVTVKTLNLRSGNSTSHGIIGKLKKGVTTFILGIKNNWYKIKTDGDKIGWASSKYIKATGEGAVAATTLNVRKGSSVSYGIVDKLTKGEKVTIVDSKNGWFKIKLADNKTGWVNSNYIKIN